MPEVPDAAEDAVQAIVDAQPARDPNDRRAVLYVGERSALHRTSEMADDKPWQEPNVFNEH